jgi:hypothetical protein
MRKSDDIISATGSLCEESGQWSVVSGQLKIPRGFISIGALYFLQTH